MLAPPGPPRARLTWRGLALGWVLGVAGGLAAAAVLVWWMS